MLWSYSSLSEKLSPHVQVFENVLALSETLEQQSDDFKIFLVISPNAKSAVQFTVVPVHCFHLIRKWKGFFIIQIWAAVAFYTSYGSLISKLLPSQQPFSV